MSAARFLLALELLATTAGLAVQGITGTEGLKLRATLQAYESGSISYRSLFEPDESAACSKMIAYYYWETNKIPTKAKLPLSRCFAMANKVEEAAELAGDYVEACPNDWRGWTVLGLSKVSLKSYSDGLLALQKAARLGDTNNYTALAATALALERTNAVTEILPQLLTLRDSRSTSLAVKVEVSSVLAIYAVKIDREDLFVQVFKELSPTDILANEGFKTAAKTGCEKFSGSEVAKVRDALESAARARAGSEAQ